TEALLASEVWFRSLVQHSTDMVMVVATDGTVSYVSPSAAEFAGVERAEVLHRPATDVFSFAPEDALAMHETFERLRMFPGSVERIVFRSTRGDGEQRWIEMMACNLLEDPAVQGIVVNARDVTETFEAERAVRASEQRLRESEARYRAVVDDQIELVCRYGPVTEITFVNRAFADFYGRTREELIGTMMLDLHPPARQDQLDARI